ncbi:unnamed protein product [Adineta steineri]|uniref:G-protein coupled receptors family 1 profile domain-containing protein n=1 Tax=Adineta steineri TaxID=433720 RepID=A0A815JLP7_9BILA|nr:unnamed protein product [Adineta steineri]
MINIKIKTNNNDEDIENINKIINSITLCVSFLTIIIGTLGGLCNIITFTSKEFRSNSCVTYFFCSTIFDIIYLLLSGTTRFLLDYFPSIRNDQSILFCKFRTYFVIVIPKLSIYFIMAATIDRYLSTSSSKKCRNLSRIKLAWRISVIIIIVSLISNSHILFFYELQSQNNNNNIYQCVPYRGFYTIFVSIYVFVLNPLITYIIMLIYILITLVRLRTLRCRLGFVNNSRKKYRIIDRHLIILIFVHVGLGMLLTFFRAGFLVYSFWTNNMKKNIWRITTELFFDKFSLISFYMNFAKSFPVNILTSSLFRRIFYQRIINLFRTICSSRKGMFNK